MGMGFTCSTDSFSQYLLVNSVFTEGLYTRYKALIEKESFSSQEAHI